MDVRSKNQPVRGVFSSVSPKQQQTRARRGREKGLCGRTDCHEKERYPFVPRILHIRERRTATLVHHCHISHHPANGERTFRWTRGSARSGRRRRRRGAKAKLIWRGRWWWVVRGKRAHDGRAESPLNEREGEPGLCAESAGVRAVQEIREYEAGQLEEPRDEGGEHECEDRAGGQLVNDHVAVHVQPRRGVHDGFPVGGRCICRRRHVGLETATTERGQKQNQVSRKARRLIFALWPRAGKGERTRTYGGRFLLRLLWDDMDVPALDPYRYGRRGFRRHVREDAIVVGAPTPRTAIAGNGLVRLRKKCTERPAKDRPLRRADDGGCGEQTVGVAVIVGEGGGGVGRGRAWRGVVVVALKVVRIRC